MNQYIYDPVQPEAMQERFGPVVKALTSPARRKEAE
jgi:hypothetical protein